MLQVLPTQGADTPDIVVVVREAGQRQSSRGELGKQHGSRTSEDGRPVRLTDGTRA
ncbi:hypothetical protein ABT186_17105 [Streptomyces sp. NPDC001634]|uniref:hypothetical protein n=1 Tax=Streptomyces sp. NPDC001634 TaxID=3154390 RepID=UPI00331F9712